jgi:hypothetical protein
MIFHIIKISNNETATLLDNVTLSGCASESYIKVYQLGNSNRRLMVCAIKLSSALTANQILIIGRTTQKPMGYTATGHAPNLASGKWYCGAVTVNPNNGDITLVNEAPVGSIFYTGLSIYYNV